MIDFLKKHSVEIGKTCILTVLFALSFIKILDSLYLEIILSVGYLVLLSIIWEKKDGKQTLSRN